jgi:hypothetical protein
MKAQLQGRPDARERLVKAFQDEFGWSTEDCTKYFDKIGTIGNARSEVNVASVGEKERESYELEGGDPLVQKGQAEPYDTSQAFSKFMKRGFAIFVMSPDGKLYAGSHKIGLFHHSSFLAGAAVAGAGEMKVEKGKLKFITNKSGHYKPTGGEMVQVFEELASRGVDLSSVWYKHLGEKDANPEGKAPWPGGAKRFYDTFKSDPKAVETTDDALTANANQLGELGKKGGYGKTKLVGGVDAGQPASDLTAAGKSASSSPYLLSPDTPSERAAPTPPYGFG